MARLILLLAACLAFCGCVGTNYGHMIGAGSNLLKAGTVSDSELISMSARMRAQEDSAANVAAENSKYAKRLSGLMAKEKSVNGVPLNYKVYITPEVNANATPDGSVRVYSGLMDRMDDDELRFVLGHEIGHIANGHSLKAMKLAYASEAARQSIGAINSTAAALSDSQLGSMAKEFINAQYSQSQESDADKYAMDFLKRNNYNTSAAGSALRKLAALGSSGSGLFDSHPDPEKRARTMDQMARNAE